ncbi:hypothetical protein B0H16DRAFT_1470125 [Mycena metata]|uniref:Uncharacterized protein n=1 Tax=Mycena metata TaxID=1033252 RepID=A0AAD7MQY1_9AGAR|nr:hypothetical protein B0H16DRAFT_1470125 [Mycena metata]
MPTQTSPMTGHTTKTHSYGCPHHYYNTLNRLHALVGRESRPSPKMPPQHRPALRLLEASPTPNIVTSSSRIVGPTLWLMLKSRNEEELRVKAHERMRRMCERAREDPTKLKEQAVQQKKHNEAYRARHQESLRIKQQLRRLDKYWVEHHQHRPLAET